MVHGKQVSIYHKEPRCVFFEEKSRKAAESVEELSIVLSYIFMAENTLDKRKPGFQVHVQAACDRLCCAVTTLKATDIQAEISHDKSNRKSALTPWAQEPTTL